MQAEDIIVYTLKSDNKHNIINGKDKMVIYNRYFPQSKQKSLFLRRCCCIVTGNCLFRNGKQPFMIHQQGKKKQIVTIRRVTF
ncbi:hypothetical protein UA45_15550 [Morganella morganii]|uniref:Uncharacterized protein n=1 Tax=Morganella morganii TaxID=582 RepID=A0A0D8L5H4_MORMO|nr:hypothetical protein UA45_15550 [Morganella morganii]